MFADALGCVVFVHFLLVWNCSSFQAGTIKRLRHPERAIGQSWSSSALKASSGAMNHVVLKFCTGCKWGARSIWIAQELLTTFNEENLSAVSLAPSRPPPGARFVITHYDEMNTPTLLWDRQAEGGFPELKVIKQSVRSKVNPGLYLGHSDSADRDESDAPNNAEAEAPALPSMDILLGVVSGPNVSIKYCTGCRWMLRSAYLATELMSTFGTEIDSITLIPSRPPEKGGIFVRLWLRFFFGLFVPFFPAHFYLCLPPS